MCVCTLCRRLNKRTSHFINNAFALRSPPFRMKQTENEHKKIQNRILWMREVKKIEKLMWAITVRFVGAASVIQLHRLTLESKMFVHSCFVLFFISSLFDIFFNIFKWIVHQLYTNYLRGVKTSMNSKHKWTITTTTTKPIREWNLLLWREDFFRFWFLSSCTIVNCQRENERVNSLSSGRRNIHHVDLWWFAATH